MLKMKYTKGKQLYVKSPPVIFIPTQNLNIQIFKGTGYTW